MVNLDRSLSLEAEKYQLLSASNFLLHSSLIKNIQIGLFGFVGRGVLPHRQDVVAHAMGAAAVAVVSKTCSAGSLGCATVKISTIPRRAKNLVTTNPKSNSNHFMENFADFGKRW